MHCVTRCILLLSLVTYLCGAADFMTLDANPLSYPPVITVTGNAAFLQVYGDESSNTSLLVTNDDRGTGNTRAYIWRLDYSRSVVLQTTNFTTTCCSGFNRMNLQLIRTTGYFFLIDNTNVLHRYLLTDLDNHTTLNLAGEIGGGNVAYTFNPADNTGYAVSPDSTYTVIFDALTMSVIHRFNYSQGDFSIIDYSRPGGWAPVVDSTRQVLYLAVQCAVPTPGIVWQYDIKDLNNPVLMNYVVWGSAPCFQEGFVDQATGILWMYESGAGWVGAFDPSDLSYGNSYYLPTTSRVSALYFDQYRHQALWLDNGADFENGPGGYTGNVYRVCSLETYPSNLRERIEWEPSGNRDTARSVSFEEATNILYVTTNNDEVYRVYVNGTDCPQGASAASSLAATWLSLFYFIM